MHVRKSVRWYDVFLVADRVRVRIDDLVADNPDDHELAMIQARFWGVFQQICERTNREALDDVAAALGRVR